MRTPLAKVLGLITLALLSATGLLARPAARIVGAFGQSQAGGRNVMVHVVIGVPPGVDANQAALAALQDLGARPFQSQEFTTTGLVWDQFFSGGPGDDYVTEYHNPAEDPAGAGGEALASTQRSWPAVPGSSFSFRAGGTTGRCPSLVKECEGPREFDGNNDAGWADLTEVRLCSSASTAEPGGPPRIRVQY